MRSVKPERKMRGNPRTNAARTPARVARPANAPPFGKRARPSESIVSRILRRVKGILTRPMLLMTAGLVILAMIAALFASGAVGRGIRRVDNAWSAVMADAGFGISEIHITGNRRTADSTILAALGMRPGESIFSADLVSARQRLAALDWIASAQVQRRYPDAIFVTLVEKRPFAIWQTAPDAHGQSHIALVERSGGVITYREIEKFRHLPKLAGAGAPPAAADIVDAVAVRRALAARVAVFDYQSGRRWNLLLDDHVTVKLPEKNWAQELDVLEHLIVDKGVLERDIAQIDLRSPSQYFFILKSGEKKDEVRGKET